MKIEPYIKKEEKKVQTLESQKTELEDSLNQSRYQELIRIEMDKIRAEGKMKEESVSDTHAIIKEAEKRLKTPSEKMQEELEPIPDLCPITDE